MKLHHHRLPSDSFVALSTGSAGAPSVRHLAAAQYSKHVLLIRGVVDLTRETGHPHARRVRDAYDLLAAVQRSDPRAARTVLTYPAVGAWARRTLRAMTGGQGLGAEPARLGELAAAAAIRSGTPCAVEVTPISGVVSLPSLGAVVLPADVRTARLRCGPDGSEVCGGGARVEIPSEPCREAPGWRPLRPISATAGGLTIRLLIEDLDPYRMPCAQVGGRLTDREATRWQLALEGAWYRLTRYHRTLAEEIHELLATLTPLAATGLAVRGATSREAFGTIAMSTPGDDRQLAAGLAHEIQHTKLAGVMEIVPLTLPDDGRRFYAPWRDDPRPIDGLLHGAYAHLGVAGYQRRQRHHERGAEAVTAHAEFARWADASRMVSETLLASRRLTAAGTSFVEGMLGTLRGWDTDDVPGPALAMARHDAEQHQAGWQRRNA